MHEFSLRLICSSVLLLFWMDERHHLLGDPDA